MTLRPPADKAPTTIAEQIDLLRSRGLIIDNEDSAAHFLSHLNYYRLRGYWFSFIESTDKFKAGTRFEDIINLYDFDRHLRLLVLDAIERFEVSLRTQWAYVLGHTAGQSAHRESDLFNESHSKLVLGIEQIYTDRGDKQKSLARYLNNNVEPPIWVICEELSLGGLSKWLSSIKESKIRQEISDAYNLKEVAFSSFVRRMSFIRNICAHHGRLWDCNKAVNQFIAPKIPLELNKQLSLNDMNKTYNALVMLAWIMKIISPASHWTINVRNLLTSRPDLWDEMGIPEDWQSFSLWQGETQ